MDEYGDEKLDFSEMDAGLDAEFDGAEADVTEIMDEGDLQESYETGDLISEMPEGEAYVDQVMDAAPEEMEVTDREALERMNEYMAEHDYGRDDYETYSRDPEWRELNHELTAEDGLEPAGDALEQMNDFMIEHDYGREDFAEYTQDPEWQALNRELMEADGLETEELPDEDVKVLTRDPDELMDAGMAAIEQNMEAVRDDLHDKGIDDPAQVEEIIEEERSAAQQEFMHDAFGLDCAASEETEEVSEAAEEPETVNQILEMPEETGEAPAGDLENSTPESDMPEEIPPEEIERILEEGSREELEELRGILMGTAAASELETAATLEPSLEGEVPPDIPEEVSMEETETVEAAEPLDPDQINYDAVYEGLDHCDFGGIDCCEDTERLDGILSDFKEDTWQELSLDEQKESMRGLADYVAEVAGLESPPEITYYNKPVDGDYGGYDSETNRLEINEYMLGDSKEAADTVAHELWHAYQTQRSLNPQTERDYQYQYNFDNYISPEDDFEGYQEQLVEAEARAFANQLKDRLSQIKGGRV